MLKYLCRRHSLVMQNIPNNQIKGFTLIELLVVTSIISLLSSIVLSTVSGARVKAQNTQAILAVNEIQKAFNLSAADGGLTLPYTGVVTLAIQPYFCVGRSSCRFFSGMVTNHSNIDSALSPYLSPAYLSNLPSVVIAGVAYDGIVYRCEAAAASICTQAALYWVEAGKSSCTTGKTVNVLSGGVICGQNVGSGETSWARTWVSGCQAC